MNEVVASCILQLIKALSFSLAFISDDRVFQLGEKEGAGNFFQVQKRK
jgi:hypothetical protein